MDRKILVVVILMFLLSPIYSMSNDGGNVPVVQKEESVKETAQMKPSDKGYPANFKFETENITVLKDSNGFAVDQNGRVLVPANRIIKDQNGNELALDNHLRNTGLTIKEFTKHNLEYLNRVLDIERKRGVKEMFRFTGDWYDNRINLDKLDELQANGFEIFNDKKEGHGNNFEGVAFTKEAVIIGEVIEKENIDINTYGFYTKFIIKVDEVIKGSDLIKANDILEVGYNNAINKYKQVDKGKKGVISLIKTLDKKDEGFPLTFYSFWELNGNKIIGCPWHPKMEETMELDKFKHRVNELIRINDAENFYKRSWKEAQK